MGTRAEFIKRKIAANKSKSLTYFEKICPDFYLLHAKKPSEFVTYLWEEYKKLKISNNAVNGYVFEYIIIALLIREEIFPFYYQAKISFVPNVNFDIFLYSDEGPISISLKTTLRERYKQAVLEADALQSVHRNAFNYIVTLDKDAIKDVNEKIKKRDIISLQCALNTSSKDFDRFIFLLKSKVLCVAPTVNVVSERQTLVEA